MLAYQYRMSQASKCKEQVLFSKDKSLAIKATCVARDTASHSRYGFQKEWGKGHLLQLPHELICLFYPKFFCVIISVNASSV